MKGLPQVITVFHLSHFTFKFSCMLYRHKISNRYVIIVRPLLPYPMFLSSYKIRIQSNLCKKITLGYVFNRWLSWKHWERGPKLKAVGWQLDAIWIKSLGKGLAVLHFMICFRKGRRFSGRNRCEKFWPTEKANSSISVKSCKSISERSISRCKLKKNSVVVNLNAEFPRYLFWNYCIAISTFTYYMD